MGDFDMINIMKLIPFGTNGFFPSFERETMCFVIPLNKTLIILDAGSGMFQFAQPVGKKLLSEVNEIHLFLSHYHQDHTFGLYAAFKLFEGKKIRVFAPEGDQEFNAFDTTQDFPEQYVREYPYFSWHMLKTGSIQLVGYRLSVREQRHRTVTSLAYRFQFSQGKSIAYLTDSEAGQESIEFVKGVDLLLHEHWMTGKRESIKEKHNWKDFMIGGHVTTIGAATIAKEAGVGKLALIHHYPFYDGNKLQKQLQIAKTVFPQSILSNDLQTIEF
jgi:ribonuclease BN (tRNA processing enzyme)